MVIQGFLIKAVCRRARSAHLVSQTTKTQPAFPHASQPRGMAQLEVSTCLGSHSPGAQNCGNSRFPHQGRLPTCQISTSGVSNNQATISIQPLGMFQLESNRKSHTWRQRSECLRNPDRPHPRMDEHVARPPESETRHQTQMTGKTAYAPRGDNLQQ